MPYTKKISPVEETKEQRIKKELAYLQKQFPWKTVNEISAVFSEKGDVNQEVLKQLNAPKNAIEYIED